jgi:hypothetical protein
MPRHHIIPHSNRQQIRVLIAEHRGVSIVEVPYPSANSTYYQYSLELGFINREEYVIYLETEMIRQRLQRNRAPRPRIRTRNLSHQQMIGLMVEVSDSMTIEVNEINSYIDNRFTRRLVLDIILRGMNYMNYRLNQLSGIIELDNQGQEHPMAGVGNIFESSPVTHEMIIDRHGERLAESNNSLCRECLFPIELGEDLCEDCHMELEIIPTWLHMS